MSLTQPLQNRRKSKFEEYKDAHMTQVVENRPFFINK